MQACGWHPAGRKNCLHGRNDDGTSTASLQPQGDVGAASQAAGTADQAASADAAAAEGAAEGDSAARALLEPQADCGINYLHIIALAQH